MKFNKNGQQMLEHLFLVMALLVLIYIFIEQRFRDDIEFLTFNKGFEQELKEQKNWIDDNFSLLP